jgi:ribose transport system permease protein
MMGIQPGRVKIAVYALSGFAASLSGVLLASRLGSGQPVTCEGWEMDAIAAVAIGGTKLSGGRGAVPGTVFGVLILAVIKNMINLQGSLNSWWQSIITGTLLLAVILTQVFGERKGA